MRAGIGAGRRSLWRPSLRPSPKHRDTCFSFSTGNVDRFVVGLNGIAAIADEHFRCNAPQRRITIRGSNTHKNFCQFFSIGNFTYGNQGPVFASRRMTLRASGGCCIRVARLPPQSFSEVRVAISMAESSLCTRRRRQRRSLPWCSAVV